MRAQRCMILIDHTLRSESEHRCVMPAATSSPWGEPNGSGNFSRMPVSLSRHAKCLHHALADITTYA